MVDAEQLESEMVEQDEFVTDLLMRSKRQYDDIQELKQELQLLREDMADTISSEDETLA